MFVKLNNSYKENLESLKLLLEQIYYVDPRIINANYESGRVKILFDDVKKICLYKLAQFKTENERENWIEYINNRFDLIRSTYRSSRFLNDYAFSINIFPNI